MSPKSHVERYEVEHEENWREIMGKIPYISFKSEWEVAVIPPFSGAVARFWVRDKQNPAKHASIYLDWFDKLGCVGEPYWEVYPVDGDVERCLLNEVQELIAIISRSLEFAPPSPSHKESRDAE